MMALTYTRTRQACNAASVGKAAGVGKAASVAKAASVGYAASGVKCPPLHE